MPKRTNEFQTVIYHTYAHMAGPGDRVTESATLKERSNGTEREVDILVERRVVGTELRLAIECRGRKHREDIEWIDALLGKYQDLDIHKVLAVSQSGFSRSALKKAGDNRIDTLTLEPVTDHPWPAGLTNCPGLGGWSRTDKPQKIGIVTEPPYPAQISINQPIFRDDGACIGSVGNLGWALYFSYQETLTQSIQERFHEFFAKLDGMRPNAITAVIEGPFRLPVFLDCAGAKHWIAHLRLTIQCDFDFNRVEVAHFALGDARLTVGTIPCGNTGRAYSVTAIQAANKPGEFRCCSVPVTFVKGIDEDDPARKECQE